MLQTKVNPHESFEKAVARFKRVCIKDGIVRETRRRRYYEKPSARRRRLELRRRRKASRRSVKHSGPGRRNTR